MNKSRRLVPIGFLVLACTRHNPSEASGDDIRHSDPDAGGGSEAYLDAGEAWATPSKPGPFVAGTYTDEGRLRSSPYDYYPDLEDPWLVPETGPTGVLSGADIVRLQGDYLYVMSAHSGLSVLDVSRSKQPRVLAHYAGMGVPIELLVDQERLIALFDEFPRERHSQDPQVAPTCERASRVVVLDVAEPEAPEVLQEFEVPGLISDTLFKNGVLHLATRSYVSCQAIGAVVTSFSVPPRGAPAQLDQLALDEPATALTVSEDRIFVAGKFEASSDSFSGGTPIQVVDVGAPSGKVKLAAKFYTSGKVEKGWQLNELNGVLRVIGTEPSTIETFDVSSADVRPLAKTGLELPDGFRFGQVQFHGDRAFAIDDSSSKLWMLDLSDPAAPRQLAGLQVASDIVDIRPAGDDFLAFANESGDSKRGLSVSLLNVADSAAPVQLQRAVFGNTDEAPGRGFPEELDRVRSTISGPNAEGLVAAAFTARRDSPVDKSCSDQQVGAVQLFGLSDGKLETLDTAVVPVGVRRPLVDGGRLIAVGDDRVAIFDIEDPTHVTMLGSVAIGHDVVGLAAEGSNIYRVLRDLETSRVELEVTEATSAARVAPTGVVDPFPTKACESQPEWQLASVDEGLGYLVSRTEKGGADQRTRNLELSIVDLKDPAAPTTVGGVAAQKLQGDDSWGPFHLTEAALLVGRLHFDRSELFKKTTLEYEVFDLRDRQQPISVGLLEVPQALMDGGFGIMESGVGLDTGRSFLDPFAERSVLTSGSVLASSHMESPDPAEPSGRFYLDRLDVSDPNAPRWLAPVNVPGTVIHYDHAAARVFTIERRYTELPLPKGEQCWLVYEDDPQAGTWIPSNYPEADPRCLSVERVLHVLELEDGSAKPLADVALDADDWVMEAMAVGDGRVFVSQSIPRTFASNEDRKDWEPGEQRVLVLDFELQEIGAIARPPTPYRRWQLYARGKHAFEARDSDLLIFDGRDSKHLGVRVESMHGQECLKLEVRDGRAYCALGNRGVYATDLD